MAKQRKILDLKRLDITHSKFLVKPRLGEIEEKKKGKTKSKCLPVTPELNVEARWQAPGQTGLESKTG